MQAVLETLEILNDPKALLMLQQSLEDIQAGRIFDHEDVKKELHGRFVNLRAATARPKASRPRS